ncbi:hypothetical protein BDK51DRAFT_36721 [Blyttiomyces helicus]|uniref:Uncharacterized protein n=1 Tax=Blyttiomyces helicus TaxID=388810 RepID=A0A4P9WUN8_9FUNG|nr:hypothetical protein BDK51DRAFT_36721 [Blyttiomyces helicus]|eukprot:RKO94836.1 hypothetical protein BDK51DRAFT_36721 [Blyttiomyces helicus]
MSPAAGTLKYIMDIVDASSKRSVLTTWESSAPPSSRKHQQNGPAEAHINCLQLTARTILIGSKLPEPAGGLLHERDLINASPLVQHNQSALELLIYGHPPPVNHLRVFGCTVWVRVLKEHSRKLWQQRELGIYVGANLHHYHQRIAPLRKITSPSSGKPLLSRNRRLSSTRRQMSITSTLQRNKGTENSGASYESTSQASRDHNPSKFCLTPSGSRQSKRLRLFQQLK